MGSKSNSWSGVIDSWSRMGQFPRIREQIHKGANYDLSLIPNSAQAFVLAALLGTRPSLSLVVARSVKTQEEIANDLEVWEVPYLFLPQIETISQGMLPDLEMAAEQIAVLEKIQNGFKGIILATTTCLSQKLPSAELLREKHIELSPGKNISREAFLESLQSAGYQRESEVTERGTYAVRGAVLDLFPWSATFPVRTEWDGDQIISLREFDFSSRRSLRSLETVQVCMLAPNSTSIDEAGGTMLRDHLPTETITFYLDIPDASSPEISTLSAFDNLEFFAHDFLHASIGDVVLQENRRQLFLDHLQDWLAEKWQIALFCNNEGEQKRLSEILRESGCDPESLNFFIKPLLRGFVWPEGKFVVLSDAEIFGRYQTLRAARKQERLAAMRARQNALEFSEFSEGDYVVHANHGIALFAGLQQLPLEKDQVSEVLVLEFAEGGRLYVPVEQAYLVSKYVGVGRQRPKLDVMGGSRWERARVAAKKAVMDYAAVLLKVQAERNSLSGHAFSSDTEWQKEFEESFIFEETPDQLSAIIDSKRDMESTRPMDRLICGDVGFGKTEVAIRAIFKTVMEGKQAAFLVPTTVLAQQHFQNLSERFADYPIKVEMLSRFRTQGEQRKVAAGLKSGDVDVVVGTHRLISDDIVFKNLGLVAIDEEQRFGVKQKEKFKQRFHLVDILTLSATPIPRTLYLALTGARDLSLIETPPLNRLPVETVVAPYDERLIRDVIERELARSGQVYFLHNRIASIYDLAKKIKMLVPKANLDIGHGRMDENELEDVMSRFVSGKTDVLLSTTIIENGLDIPNANTIIIDRADRFGLADLYQLRGRVGRAHHKAYAYLLLPRHLVTVADARKRVNAIKQYSQLGAGFKIAMRDLEIRGAGNLLGTAQSGHIAAVGFDLYCQLLKSAVAQIKGEKKVRFFNCKLDFDFLVWQESLESQAIEGAYVPRSYIPTAKDRIEAYRKIAEISQLSEATELFADWRDCYGPYPPALERLMLATQIRVLAQDAGIHHIEVEDGKLVMKKGSDFVMINGRFPRLTASDALSKLNEIKNWVQSLAKNLPRLTEPKK